MYGAAVLHCQALPVLERIHSCFQMEDFSSSLEELPMQQQYLIHSQAFFTQDQEYMVMLEAEQILSKGQTDFS